jgi:hypothetical protein
MRDACQVTGKKAGTEQTTIIRESPLPDETHKKDP